MARIDLQEWVNIPSNHLHTSTNSYTYSSDSTTITGVQPNLVHFDEALTDEDWLRKKVDEILVPI